MKKRKLDSSSQSLQKVNNLSRQRKYDENVVRYILDSMSPLSTVEMPCFRKMFNGKITFSVMK